MLLLVCVGCAEDDAEQTEHDVDFCVRAAWQNGLSGGSATRALTTTDLLADGTGDIDINTADYPSTIEVKCKKDGEQVGETFTLTKGSSLCTEHKDYDYWQYTPSVFYKDNKIIRENYSFDFSATIDGGDELVGSAGKNNISGHHMLITLSHTKALVRFAFKVSEKYDNIRYILLTSIKLNGSDCVLVNKILNKTSSTFIAYAYVDPEVVTIGNENTLACTYNIYDKDAEFIPDAKGVISSDAITTNESHLTRKDVIAQNKFTFNKLKDAQDAEVKEIKAGYYYDLKVTLNPDYLYVLSEHDNKQHITIE